MLEPCCSFQHNYNIMSNHHGIAMPVCTVQLWYNKQRPKKNKTASLYVQLIVGGESDEIPIKNLEWPVDRINWESKRLEPRHPDDQDLVVYNAIIERERAKYWNVIMHYLKQDMPFTLSDVFRGVNQFSNGHLFCEFMAASVRARQKTKVLRDRIKYSTGQAHLSSLTQLREYLNGGDVDIKQIDDRFLEKYADHLRDTIGESTVWVRIKDIKSYLSYAKRQKLAINENHTLFKVSLEEPDPNWLEEHELQAMLDMYFNPETSVLNKRNLRAFLFASFTGLRISDLKRFNKKWISDNEFSFIPQKIRASKKDPKPIVIPIIPLARDFINDLSAESFELPEDQVYNRELKVLGDKAGITKKLTSHVARHTFATWLAIDGVPVLIISKLLGHKKQETTMRYIHIAEMYKATEMMKMQRRFGRRLPDDKSPRAQ